MDFLIADTFTDSLARLTGDEQKAVKTTAFDLQMNPVNSGMSLHKLDKAKDKNFWSVRVSADIRLIVHRTDGSILLCYVDHHDKAYAWAERRKLETHPKTGAAQLVEVRETVREIAVPVYVQKELPLAPKPALFANASDEELLDYGVPVEWLKDVREATEDSLLNLADNLPGEAAEALLQLATGGKPRARGHELVELFSMAGSVDDRGLIEVSTQGNRPFEHPDAQRRFRVIANVEELKQALDFPWDKWSIFLHPAQKDLVERDYNGAARVSGSAGTGKTIVAVHRAVYLARMHPDSRVLLTTFSDVLASALRTKLKRLLGDAPRLAERIDVHSLDAIGRRLYRSHVGAATIVSPQPLREIVAAASEAVVGHKFSRPFLLTEWEHVVDAWQLDSWESYRDVARLGRKVRLPEAQRKTLWAIFDRVRAELSKRGLITHAELFSKLATAIGKAKNPPFDFAVVDEAQDISISHLRFLAALGGSRSNALFFAGDLSQRIFQQPFSWKALGVDIRGRSRNLRVNYRTSHQIRAQADRLLGPEVVDVDGNIEDRANTVSVFNGPPPLIQILKDQEEEIRVVAQWLADRTKEGVVPHEFGIFVRSPGEIHRAQAAVGRAGLPFKLLDENVEMVSGKASVSTMHLAKGLEFRAVVVMACDDEILPLQSRMEAVADDGDLEEVYKTERHLLYVACTRARDHLLVTSVAPASEFLDDLRV